MAKQNYTRITTPVGVAVYPHLTEADTKFNAAGLYHTKLAFERDEVEELIEKLEGERDEFISTLDAKTLKTHKTIAPVFEEELDDEGEETGRVIFKANLKAHVVTKAGKEWDQEPMIFDSANNQIKDIASLKLWGGSRIRLQADVIPYAMGSTKTLGVSLRIRAVQVVELSSGNAGSPFDEYDGGDVIVDTQSPVDKPFSNDDDDDLDDY